MKFKFKKHFLLIEFSWKEIFWIIVRKHFKLDRRSTYNFASILVSSVTQMIEKYGDYRTHGPIKNSVLFIFTPITYFDVLIRKPQQRF